MQPSHAAIEHLNSATNRDRSLNRNASNLRRESALHVLCVNAM
jgi:hypothetical protein